MMVCNTQNHWVSEICPSENLSTQNTQRFGNRKGKGDTYSVGSLRNHWTAEVMR
jgi:hypothetical protein